MYSTDLHKTIHFTCKACNSVYSSSVYCFNQMYKKASLFEGFLICLAMYMYNVCCNCMNIIAVARAENYR